ncbi:MAG: ester cyclase [Dehalococcoidia bacterium]
MSAEENKVIARRIYEEAINQGKGSVIDELVALDVVDHNPFPDAPPGREGAKAAFNLMHSAVPDIRVTVEDMVAEGNTVASRLTFRGTHKGEFMGVAPTNKQISFSVADFLRISGGKVVERWGVEDMAPLMQQLGVIPSS